VAARVGVSPNTFRAHYERLLDANAIWSVPELDFARYRGAALARLVLTLAGGADRRRVLAALKSAIPTVMEHPSPEGTPALLSVHVQAASVGELEEWTLAARALPGVVDAEALHPRRFRVYGAWLDQRVQAAIDIAGG
jgi:hypothetical protein